MNGVPLTKQSTSSWLAEGQIKETASTGSTVSARQEPTCPPHPTGAEGAECVAPASPARRVGTPPTKAWLKIRQKHFFQSLFKGPEAGTGRSSSFLAEQGTRGKEEARSIMQMDACWVEMKSVLSLHLWNQPCYPSRSEDLTLRSNLPWVTRRKEDKIVTEQLAHWTSH